MKSIEQPDGIIITLPARFFVEYGHEKYLSEIKRMNDDQEMIWYRVMKNLPKQDFLYVYTIVANKVHHRSQFAGLLRNTTKTFPRPEGGSRTFENANFVMMTGPVVFPDHDFPLKGFQGFRYTQKLF